MRSRSTTARILWLLVAALQLTLPGAAAWGDARLEREAARAPHPASHIESHRTDQCPRAHPPDCAVCRHLSTPIGLAPGHLASPEFSVDAPILAAADLAPPTPALGLPLSRAPPLS